MGRKGIPSKKTSMNKSLEPVALEEERHLVWLKIHGQGGNDRSREKRLDRKDGVIF